MAPPSVQTPMTYQEMPQGQCPAGAGLLRQVLGPASRAQLPCRRASNPASSSTGTPNSWALASLLPASSPATT